MTPTLRPISIVAVGLGLVLFTQSRPDALQAPSPSPKTLKDACAYLMKEDAVSALGEPVTGPDGKPTFNTGDGGTASSCEYSGAGLHKVHLNLITFTPATAAVYAQLCAQKTKDGLSGLGSVACWYNTKHEELQVLKGTTFLSIEMRRSGDPTESITGVAKAVYGRLP